jgi:hypothetical protein
MAGLVRYEEILVGEITHAIRFTAPQTQRAFVWPGRHYASFNTSVLLPPMGQRFRLKANYDISGFSPRMQVVLRALKKYGMMLADNGLAWEMQFAADPRWDDNELVTLKKVIGANFEAVDASSVMMNADSGEAAQPGVSVIVSPATATLSASQSRRFTAAVAGSSLGVVWSMNPLAGTLSASGLYTAPASISTTQTVTIRATLSDGSKYGAATVTLQAAPPATLASVAVSPSSTTGGNNVSVTVTLTGAAPAAGAAVTLTGSNPAFPTANVVVAANAIFQTFSLPTAVVTATTAVTITATYNGVSVVSSQLTLTPVLPAGGTSATFVKADTTTHGSWKGVYGADGFNVINDNASYPSYVTVTPSGDSSYTWIASTTDLRALQKSASATDRIGACWWAYGLLNIDLAFQDGAAHQVALYLVDYDLYGGGRSEQVDILDGNGTVLSTRFVADFSGGQYLVWNISGHVVVRITNANSRSNAVISGLFFGAGAPAANAAATATFVKTDTTTLGTWKGVYGADGFSVAGDASSFPSYVTAALSGNFTYTWIASTTDPRAMQKSASATDRIGACWCASGSFNIDLAFKDGDAHQVALYVVDYDLYGGGRAERVDILDAGGTVLSTQSVSAFSRGQYLVWNVSGHVMVRITNTNAASNAVLSGIFFR